MNSYWKHFFIDNGDIALIESGIQKNMPNQINDYTVKHNYVIHLVLSGKGYFIVNNQRYQLEKFDCFILKKSQAVYYQPDPNNPWTIGWIGLGGSNINNYLNTTILEYNDTYHLEEDSLVYFQLLELILFLDKANAECSSSRLKILGLLYHLLGQINEELPINQVNLSSPGSDIPQIAADIYGFLTNNFEQSTSIEAIAHHFDISRNYLFQLCKRYYQCSPKQIVLESRMEKASHLLRSTSLQVNEIAESVGYRDAFQFSKMFKNYFGHSPSQFRILSDASIDDSIFEMPLFFQEQSLMKPQNFDTRIWL